MGRTKTEPSQVWECPKCGFIYEAIVPVKTIGHDCPKLGYKQYAQLRLKGESK